MKKPGSAGPPEGASPGPPGPMPSPGPAPAVSGRVQQTHITVEPSRRPDAAGAAPAAVPVSVKPQTADQNSALLALLKVEAEARDAQSLRDLQLLIANETRKLTRARQIFVLAPGVTNALEVKAISSVPSVDRNAPLVIFIENLMAASQRQQDLAKAGTVPLDGRSKDVTEQSYPFRSLMWVPLRHSRSEQVGGLLLAREDAWADQDLVVANRLSATFAHAWQALQPKSHKLGKGMLQAKRWHLAALAALAAALVLVRIPVSALAPVEIVARNPFVVAAPIDGVIETVAVEPNQMVKTGDLLVKLADTTLKNRYEVAERDVQVAEARLKQAHQMAFNDPRGLHEIGIARAEMALKSAERDFARDLLAKSEIRAQRDGIAMYSDKRELVGRPVAVGERMLEVADAAMVEARVELPVADAITLGPGARVKLFLDSDPLRPWPASVTHADYKAKLGDNDVVSFRVTAALEAIEGRQLPRLGVRGTAQLRGENVSLGLYLFRRPITALRQWVGL